jgi:hypothetical protein
MTNNIELFKTHLYKLIKEELESGEEEKQAGLEKALYDLVLEPADLESALAALSDIKNYGIYANNLRDPKVITKIFGPSVPATKGRVAKETWDQSNENERLSKIIDIKSRAPQEWAKVEQQLQSKFDEWSVENDNDSFNEFVITLEAKDLPMDFFGKYASTFYPMKTPDNLKKYSGVMAKDKDFIVDGDKIVFPQKKNPFETKDYLTKVLKTIMGNAKLQYSISQKESDDQPATTSNTQGKVEKINFIKTFDTPELAAKFKKLIPKDFAEKTTVDGGKITVSDITDSQKKNLITSALQFMASQPKKPMKESLKDQIKQAVMEVLQEKKLSKAEKNKKEDIVKAMAKQGASKDSKTYAIATAKAKQLAEGEGDEATVYADKAYRWGKKGTTFPTPQLADLWRAVRQAYIDGGKAKKLTEGEGETSMDDILDAFQAALAIENDVKADQALKAVYMALKDKVKGKLGQAADYAKDKLTKYADNLEENV